jgi:hypothetical protein
MEWVNETYLNSTLAYCDVCRKTELARILAGPQGVFLERVCAARGHERVRIAVDSKWYQQRMAWPQKPETSARTRASEKGCPLDCGPCQWHSGRLHLPVFSITNDCNLDCPICFTYNRPDQKYYKSIADVEKIVRHIIEHSGGVQLINLTGGEPTLHPQLFEVIAACRRPEIGRITLNSNGLKIANDFGFAEQIKQAGVQIILSLDTLDPEKSRIIHGRDITGLKKKCLETLEALDIPTTILSVCIKGVNEPDVAAITHDCLRKYFVKGVTIQNMTFTGKNGSRFSPRSHMTMDEVELLISGKDGITREDFFPLASYHPLCYSVAYYLYENNRLISLARVLAKDLLYEMTRGHYHLQPEQDFSRDFEQGLNRLWAAGADEETIRTLRQFFLALYPRDQNITEAERRRLIEKKVKMLYIHPHMDRDNFDIDRVSRCGDLVPDESGRLIPACAYNLLYRQKDARFWVEK